MSIRQVWDEKCSRRYGGYAGPADRFGQADARTRSRCWGFGADKRSLPRLYHRYASAIVDTSCEFSQTLSATHDGLLSRCCRRISNIAIQAFKLHFSKVSAQLGARRSRTGSRETYSHESVSRHDQDVRGCGGELAAGIIWVGQPLLIVCRRHKSSCRTT